jgi:hypothetical protein
MVDHGMAPIPVLVKLDRTNQQQKVITRQETITAPYTARGSSKGLFLGGAASTAPDARFLYLAAWYGTSAEISDTQAAALLAALGW